ncbi:type II toxin-antitoxin system prevent-host-death family antitoxin [Azonexus sp.]|uniref:type II toxin-antitoxin system prevent-host-death family antitoxin n=1 Tax=Azonexus sp. TaxID=1872668 RepID=UPI0035AE545E
MHIFTISNLREHAGELIRRAENGELSVVTRRGKPVFVAVSCDEALLSDGLGLALAIRLFDDERISLSQAARLADVSVSEMIDLLGRSGVAVIRSTAETLERELADFGLDVAGDPIQ